MSRKVDSAVARVGVILTKSPIVLKFIGLGPRSSGRFMVGFGKGSKDWKIRPWDQVRANSETRIDKRDGQGSRRGRGSFGGDSGLCVEDC